VRGQRGAIPDTAPAAWRTPVEAFERHCRAAGHTESTIGLRRYYLLWRLAPGHPDPWAVTTDDLLALVADPGLARATRKNIRSVFRRFYSWAGDEGLVAADPSARLPTVSEPAGKPRPAPSAVLCRAIDIASPREVAWLLLAALAGLRRTEIATLRVADVLEDSLRITGKGDVTRVVPLHPDLAAVLRPQLASDGYAFPGPERGHVTVEWVGRRLAQLLGGRYSAHTLRHAAASAWYSVDRDILAVRDLLGHASVATTQRYCATPDDAARRAVLGR
jgi:integrase